MHLMLISLLRNVFRKKKITNTFNKLQKDIFKTKVIIKITIIRDEGSFFFFSFFTYIRKNIVFTKNNFS